MKFTFGTNNSGPELRRLEYCLEMVEQCGLTWQDLWTPKPDGQKPIQVGRARSPPNGNRAVRG